MKNKLEEEEKRREFVGHVSTTCMPEVGEPSYSWVDAFVKRNSQYIKKKKAKQVPVNRVTGANPLAIERYMECLDNLMSKHRYHPSLVFNFDETGVSIDKRPSSVVVPNQKGVEGVTPALPQRIHFTMGVTIGSDGSLLPPFVILPGARVPELPEFLLEWGLFSAQQNGWITIELFEQWAQTILIPFVREKRSSEGDENLRALLLVDNHSTRRNEELLKELEEQKIDVVFLPPNTSHISQPLDVLVFGGMKNLLARRIQRRILPEDPLPVARAVLIESAIESVESVATRSTIRKAFELTGISPLNKDILLQNPLVGEPPESLARRTQERSERMSVCGPSLRHSLELKRMEREKKNKEKEERKKKREEDIKKKRENCSVEKKKIKRKRRKLDWQKASPEDSSPSSNEENTSEEEEEE